MAFTIRGYYVIPSRIQTWGVDEWKHYIDCMAEDGCNFLIFWTAGGFPSKKYPETWHYNRQHRNMSERVFGPAIDYAHSRGIEVVLGFTPYAYDGVASYAAAHPELAGLDPGGSVHHERGIHDVGMWLCPAHEQSRRFMLEYAREMIFDFYPHADGLLIESSDYGHCQCSYCAQQYMEAEWEFTSTLSQELWQVKPDARIVIYPLYYQRGVVQPDTRYSLFFTPHSAPITPEVMTIPCDKLYWDILFTLGPTAAANAARIAADHDMQGFIVAMEAFSYTSELNGRSVTHHPFDVPWLQPGSFPFDDLVPAMMRFSYTYFSRYPHASINDYKAAIVDRFFGDGTRLSDADDLLFVCDELQRFVWFGRRSVLVHPEEFEKHYQPNERTEADVQYQTTLERFRRIAGRHEGHELGRIAQWIVDQWYAIRPGAGRSNL